MISGIGQLISNMYGIKEDIAFGYAKTIVTKASKYGFDPLLIVSIIHHESRFDPNANSGTGTGLMQIVHKYHKQKVPKKSDLYDPIINIQTGVRILSEYRNISKTESDAILRYNGTLGKSTAYLKKIRTTQKKLTQEIEQYI